MKYYHLSGTVLVIFTELVKYLFASNPSWVEDYYAKGIYLVVSFILQKMSILYILPGLLAIPTLFFVFIFLVSFSKQNKIVKFSLIINSLGFLYFLFYFVWGYNYYRLPIDHQWKFKSTPFTYKQLASEYEETTNHLLNIRKLLADTAKGVDMVKFNVKNEEQRVIIQNNLQRWLKNHGFPSRAKVPIKSNLPKGIFLHFSTAGMYFPFSGEGNVDPGLHPIHFTSVMAHEMAHGYGFADEGTCNFLAFICHTNDRDPFIAYATTLGYWRYLASNVRRISPSYFNEKMKELPTGLRNDLIDIQNYSNSYEDWMPNLQYKMYDAYLKGQGIKEGMLNYNKVIGLVLAYKAAFSFILDDSSLPR